MCIAKKVGIISLTQTLITKMLWWKQNIFKTVKMHATCGITVCFKRQGYDSNNESCTRLLLKSIMNPEFSDQRFLAYHLLVNLRSNFVCDLHDTCCAENKYEKPSDRVFYHCADHFISRGLIKGKSSWNFGGKCRKLNRLNKLWTADGITWITWITCSFGMGPDGSQTHQPVEQAGASTIFDAI